MKSLIKKFLFYLKNKYVLYSYREKIAAAVPGAVVNVSEYVRFWSGKAAAEEQFTVRFTEGFSLICNAADLSAVSETCVLKDYEPTEDFKIHSGEVVLDVGANIGSFSARCAHAGALVYAVEPDGRNVERFWKNMRVNHFEGTVRLFEGALHPVSGSVHFQTSPSVGGHTVTAVSENTVTVPALSLADFFERYHLESVDLMKIDIEGAEYDIFKSLTPDTFARVKKIVGEYHIGPYSSEGFPTIFKYLSPHFRVVKRYEPYYFYALK